MRTSCYATFYIDYGGKSEWNTFIEDLSIIFPFIGLEVKFAAAIDQYIEVSTTEAGRAVPLDLAGTGFLQAVQILAYLHLFAPKLIVLDEPDSHLHPNNQRLLCNLLKMIASERDVQVIMTTHSRHVLDALRSDAKILWVQGGTVSKATVDDQVDILLELGALDVKEAVQAGQYRVIVLTEDTVTHYLTTLVRNSGFDMAKTALLSYGGVTNVNLLNPLVRQIKAVSNAAIVVHRDRDFLNDEEAASWEKQIRQIGAEPFLTLETDIEGYFCKDDYLASATKARRVDVGELKAKVMEEQESDTISAYVNWRIDQERKAGTFGKLDIGKLSAKVAEDVRASQWRYIKGKKKLRRVRFVCQQVFGLKYDIDFNAEIPRDENLAKMAARFTKQPGGCR